MTSTYRSQGSDDADALTSGMTLVFTSNMALLKVNNIIDIVSTRNNPFSGYRTPGASEALSYDGGR